MPGMLQLMAPVSGMQPLGFVSREGARHSLILLLRAGPSPALAAGGTRTSVLPLSHAWEHGGMKVANLGEPASPPSVLRKSATSLKQDLKSVL